MKAKKRTARVLISVFLGFVVFILIICLVLQIGYVISKNNTTGLKPNYEMTDISELLDKSNLDENDYDILYRQTGLTKIGIDRALSHGKEGKSKILSIQKNFFKNQTLSSDLFAPFMGANYIKEHVTPVYLEDGDIVVTASTYLSFLKIGHAGLVTDGKNKKVLQAVEYGSESKIGSIDDFTDRVNFMILSPKTPAEIKIEAARYAAKNLTGLPYSAFMGTNPTQNEIKKTQCAHIVWFAYHASGYELFDKNKILVMPYDLANSDKAEVVQVFGFDIDKLWDKM